MVGVQGGKGLYNIGYVPKEKTAIVNALANKAPALRVVCGTWGRFEKTTFGARLKIA